MPTAGGGDSDRTYSAQGELATTKYGGKMDENHLEKKQDKESIMVLQPDPMWVYSPSNTRNIK